MTILIASTNPNKIEGTKKAFLEFPEVFGAVNKLEIQANKFPSNVPDQPIGYEQILSGAYNRALNAKDSDTNSIYDFYVGIESGIVFVRNHPHVVTYACVMNKNNRFYFGSSAFFPLPKNVINTLFKGQELAVFAEELTGVHDVRSKGGLSGYLFKDKYTRADVNYLSVKGALAGFIRAEKFNVKVDKNKLPKIVYISTSISDGIVKDIPLQIADWVEKLGGIVNNKHVIYAGHDKILSEKYTQEYAKKYFDLELQNLKKRIQSASFIYRLDTLLVDQATHLIALLDKTSSGVAIEIEHALTKPARGLPQSKILGLVHKDNYLKVSGMLRGSTQVYKNFEIKVYKNIKDIQNLVVNFLQQTW